MSRANPAHGAWCRDSATHSLRAVSELEMIAERLEDALGDIEYTLRGQIGACAMAPLNVDEIAAIDPFADGDALVRNGNIRCVEQEWTFHAPAPCGCCCCPGCGVPAASDAA